MDIETALRSLPILDLRSAASFHQCSLAGSCNIPLHTLCKQMYLLPDKHELFTVVLPSPDEYQVTLVPTEGSCTAKAPSPTQPRPVFLQGMPSVESFLSDRGWACTYLRSSDDLWLVRAHVLSLKHTSCTIHYITIYFFIFVLLCFSCWPPRSLACA